MAQFSQKLCKLVNHILVLKPLPTNKNNVVGIKDLVINLLQTLRIKAGQSANNAINGLLFGHGHGGFLFECLLHYRLVLFNFRGQQQFKGIKKPDCKPVFNAVN